MSDTRVICLLLLAGALVGCPQTKGAPAARSATTFDPPVITIVTAPDPQSTLAQGRFYIKGQITADAGLDPERPLLFGVEDLETGLWSPLDLLGLVTNRGGELQGDTSFNLQTGEFILDGLADMVVEAGNKRLKLIAKDSQAQETVWSVDVESEPFWSPTQAELGAARAVFAERIADIAEEYRDHLAALAVTPGFEAPIEWTEFDLELMNLVCAYYRNLAEDPHCVQRVVLAETLQQEVATLLTEAGIPSDPVAASYWNGIANSAAWEVHRAKRRLLFADMQQLVVTRLISDQVDDRDMDLAYFEHTFVDLDFQPGTGNIVATLTLSVYQDEGTPVAMYTPFLHGWDPQDVIPNTADVGSPGFQLEILFKDLNENDLIDTIECNGFEILPMTGEPHPLSHLDHYGHLFHPLSRFLISPYVNYKCG